MKVFGISGGLIRGYGSRAKMFPVRPELPLWKVHDLGITVDFSGDELQVFLQIVSQGGH